MKKEILKTLGAISLMLALALVVGYVGTAFGWTPAPASPPADNTPAPVNVGYDQQTRKGQLILDGTTLLDGIETALKYPLVISRGAILLGVQDTAVSDGIANLALDVAGKIRIRDAAGAGKVLTSDANGVAGWQLPEDAVGSGGAGDKLVGVHYGASATKPASANYALIRFSGHVDDVGYDTPASSYPFEGAMFVDFDTLKSSGYYIDQLFEKLGYEWNDTTVLANGANNNPPAYTGGPRFTYNGSVITLSFVGAKVFRVEILFYERL